MTRRFGRFARQNTIAMLALFLALGGTSFAAATLINGKSIKPHTIAKNRLTNKAIKQLKGNRGPAGPQGAQGPQGVQGAQGVQGPIGPSNVYATSVFGNTQIGTSSVTPVTILSLTLPAGNWAITATTGLTNISGATRSAWCTLNNGGTQLGITRGFDVADGTQRSSSATVLGQVTLASSGVVTFQCYADSTNVWIPAASKPAMQAIQVGSLTVSSPSSARHQSSRTG